MEWSIDRCSVENPFGQQVGKVATIQGFECIFANILGIATTLAGLAVFIMLLAGGIKYLTSGGDPKKTEEAKGQITYALAGLVVIIAGWFILKFLSEFTGLPQLLRFSIPGP